MTDSPNGRQSRKVTARATRPVVRMRIGWSVRRSQARTLSSQPSGGGSSSASAASGASSGSETGQSARRIVTSARIGIRIPSCGLMSAATTAKIADRSGWSRHSSRRPSSRKTTPTESTWPQTTLSNQLIGLTTATNAAARATRSPPAELEDHRPDEPADGQVGEDRRDLDQGDADPAGQLPDEPEQPQDVEIARGVVVEEVALVEAVQALAGEVDRPRAERTEVHAEAGSGEEVCDDEAEGKTEREDHEDRADGSLRPGHPRRRSCASLGPAGRGASHRERLLHERGRWTGA